MMIAKIADIVKSFAEKSEFSKEPLAAGRGYRYNGSVIFTEEGTLSVFAEYRFQTELHAHSSPASPCGDFPPEEVVRRYAALGYDSLVLCNHFHCGLPDHADEQAFLSRHYDDYERAVKAAEGTGLTVIYGCEIRFARENNNDYLLFGIDPSYAEEAYDYLEGGIADFSKAFRRKDRLLIQAHPFRKGMEPVDPALLDGIESFNLHPGHNSAVGIAARYAAEKDFTVTCGTDFHHDGHEGVCGVLSKTKMNDSHDLQALLRSRDYLFRIGGSLVLPYGA